MSKLIMLLSDYRQAVRAYLEGIASGNTYVFVYRLRDGRIASVAEHFDPLVVAEKLVLLMRQLAAKGGQ